MTRILRGLTAAALLAAAGTAAGLEHHLADHAGTLLHVDEHHGSHGDAIASGGERLPAPMQVSVPAEPVQTAALPDLAVDVRLIATEADRDTVPATGRAPPAALGSRAPPA